MAWALQPVVNVGLQILLSIYLGWLLVRLRVLDAEKYMPQVNTLVLWVGVTCLSGYYLGLKLQLDDAEAWRSLAAYILWITVTKCAILLYCLIMRRIRLRSCHSREGNETRRSSNVSGVGTINGGGGDDGYECDGDGGSGSGSNSFFDLREFALLTLVLTANNIGMIGLPIMDATFGLPGRRLALLTGIPVMLWVIPASIFALEMHKLRAEGQQQPQKPQSNNSGTRFGKGDEVGGNLKRRGGAAILADNQDVRTASLPTLATGDGISRGADGAAARYARHGGSSAGVLRRRTGIAAAASFGKSEVLLTQFRHSVDGCSRAADGGGGGGHRDGGDRGGTAGPIDADHSQRRTGQQNAHVSVLRPPPTIMSLREAAKLRRSLDGGQDCQRAYSGPGEGDGYRSSTIDRIHGFGRGRSMACGVWEMGRGQCAGAPTDLTLPGPMLIGAAKAAAGAVTAAAVAAAAGPRPPLLPPCVSPFTAMACSQGGEALGSGGGDGADAAQIIIRPHRSGSLCTYHSAGASSQLSTTQSGNLEEISVEKSMMPKPTQPVPGTTKSATLSLVSALSVALHGSDAAERRARADVCRGGTSSSRRRTSAEAYAPSCTTQQPDKSLIGVAASAASTAAAAAVGITVCPSAGAKQQQQPLHPSLSPSIVHQSTSRLQSSEASVTHLPPHPAAAVGTALTRPKLPLPPQFDSYRPEQLCEFLVSPLVPVAHSPGAQTAMAASMDMAAIPRSAVVAMLSAPSSPVASAKLETRPSSTSLSAVDLPRPHRWLMGELEEGVSEEPAVQGPGAAGGVGSGGGDEHDDDGDDQDGVEGLESMATAAAAVDGSKRTVFRQLCAVMWTVSKNPLLWSLLLSVVMNLSGLRKFLDPESPSFVLELGFIPELLHWYASIAVPVSLVSIGVWMYGKRMPPSLLKQAGTLLLLKVAVLPLLQAACAKAIGLPNGPTITLVLLALCPTATTSFVVAAHFGHGTDVVSAVTVGGTILLVPAVLVVLELSRALGVAVHLAGPSEPVAA